MTRSPPRIRPTITRRRSPPPRRRKITAPKTTRPARETIWTASRKPVRPASATANTIENGENGEGEEEEIVEQLGGDAMDETPYRAPRLRRQYKIQEVIKRRQVLLIQVVKEERGNKGAALTTYLSLAGRYSVLMPNTARGGGISRKITDAGDRKRLKEIAQDLEVPEGMGVILRTAGAARTKHEIQRDFEYLMRMWEQVRELTLTSSAPALVYEEGSLIKRAIRDLYSKEIDEVIVAGENGYREARDFMRLLMPSHVKNVHYYRDPQPIFAKWGAESQLDALFHNQVTLKSGGYLVINQTEALVAIDVNSGRSTREHNIEDTALRTNLEAADEVARQLRLRDLAGLIVVDFIDMEESRNNRAVERRLKEALKDDRARIQVGRISHFGLLEMSRQRIRTGVLEGSSVVCPHCAGVGTVRSTASVAVHVMRVLEDALIKSASHNIVLRTRTDIALYILNQKRSLLRLIEERFGVSVVSKPTILSPAAPIMRWSAASRPWVRAIRCAASIRAVRSRISSRSARRRSRPNSRKRPRSRPPSRRPRRRPPRNAPRAKPAAVVVAVVAVAAISSARALASTPARRSPPTRRWRRSPKSAAIFWPPPPMKKARTKPPAKARKAAVAAAAAGVAAIAAGLALRRSIMPATGASPTRRPRAATPRSKPWWKPRPKRRSNPCRNGVPRPARKALRSRPAT